MRSRDHRARHGGGLRDRTREGRLARGRWVAERCVPQLRVVPARRRAALQAPVKCTCCEGIRGGFADYIRLDDGRFVFAIPDALDSPQTAPLLCGGQTVWTPLRQQTRAGDRVGILGLGGLGHMAIKFAAALGCDVTALSSTSSKREEALAIGAHRFVAHGDEKEVEAAAASLDFILVTLATTEPVDFAKFFTLLRPRGTLCFVGMCPPITADVSLWASRCTTSRRQHRRPQRDARDARVLRAPPHRGERTRPMSDQHQAPAA